jgi:hypothetical protein
MNERNDVGEHELGGGESHCQKWIENWFDRVIIMDHAERLENLVRKSE